MGVVVNYYMLCPNVCSVDVFSVMEETTESTTGYSHEPVENSGTCTVNIESDQCTANAEEE